MKERERQLNEKIKYQTMKQLRRMQSRKIDKKKKKENKTTKRDKRMNVY